MVGKIEHHGTAARAGARAPRGRPRRPARSPRQRQRAPVHRARTGAGARVNARLPTKPEAPIRQRGGSWAFKEVDNNTLQCIGRVRSVSPMMKQQPQWTVVADDALSHAEPAADFLQREFCPPGSDPMWSAEYSRNGELGPLNTGGSGLLSAGEARGEDYWHRDAGAALRYGSTAG